MAKTYQANQLKSPLYESPSYKSELVVHKNIVSKNKSPIK